MLDSSRTDTPTAVTVAVIDADEITRRSLRQALERAGHPAAERDPANLGGADVLFLGVSARPEEAVEMLKRIEARDPDLPVVVVAAERVPAASLRALRQQSWELLVRPVVDEQIAAAARRAVERRRLAQQARRLGNEVDERRSRGLMLGQSPAIRVFMQRAERLLDSRAPIFIVGESGSGKHTMARAIHELGQRQNGPFVTWDCSVTSAATHAIEVLGGDRGGAGPQKGAIERAHEGTLVVENIADADPATQEVLLRLVEQGTIRPVGATRDIPVDVRVVATSSRPLVEEVRNRRFREELQQRLQAETLRMPPLRERREDIPLLVAGFMAQMRRDGGVGAERVSSEAMELFMRHEWSGNVRELQTVVQRAMLASDSREIRREHLPPTIRGGASSLPSPYADQMTPVDGNEPVVTLRELERREIMKALAHTGGSVAQAARKLGIGRATLYRRLSELNLPPPTVAMRNALAGRLTNPPKVD